MKKSSHISSHRHARRKPILGLTPAGIIEQMAKEAKDGKKVRSVRGSDAKSKRSLLPVSRKATPPAIGGQRVPSAASGSDPVRAVSSVNEAVPDSLRPKAGSQLSVILKRMLGENAPPALLGLEGVEKIVTNAELLAAVVMGQAVAGKQWAVEMVRDQTEGKPQRAAQEGNAQNETEGFLDRVGQSRLNDIAKGKK